MLFSIYYHSDSFLHFLIRYCGLEKDVVILRKIYSEGIHLQRFVVNMNKSVGNQNQTLV